MIHLTHAQPDGTPARAECDCGALWLGDLERDSFADFRDFFVRHQRRGRYLGPVSTPIASICGSQAYHVGGVPSPGATSPWTGNPTDMPFPAA